MGAFRSHSAARSFRKRLRPSNLTLPDLSRSDSIHTKQTILFLLQKCSKVGEMNIHWLSSYSYLSHCVESFGQCDASHMLSDGG